MKKLIKVFAITVLILFIVWIVALVIAIRNMIIDHKCYVMDDDTFYSNKMCKRYWEDRKNGKR